MASNRFHGEVGYGISTEVRPDVLEDVITERKYFGDVTRNSRLQRDENDRVSVHLSASATISIVADAFANEHFYAIRYVRWAGQYWKVSEVDASVPPRLLLRLGEVYNGLKAETPGTPEANAGE